MMLSNRVFRLEHLLLPYLWVEFRISDNWPSEEELAARNAAIDELNNSADGRCTGSGGGIGAMDFSFRAEAEAKARDMIDTVVRRHSVS